MYIILAPQEEATDMYDVRASFTVSVDFYPNKNVHVHTMANLQT